MTIAVQSGSSETWLFNELNGTFLATENSAPVYLSKQMDAVACVYADTFGGTTVHLQWSLYPDKGFQDITDMAGNPAAYTAATQGSAFALSGFYIRAQITGQAPFTVINLSVKVA
jgi:hypothetical protein